MVKTKEITSPVKIFLLRAAELNTSIRQISTELNISKSAIGAILMKYRETGSTKNKPRSKITSEREGRFLAKLCGDNPRKNAVELLLR